MSDRRRDKLQTDARDVYYSYSTTGIQQVCSAIFFISGFFGDDLPLIEILRSLVAYVNHHNKDYLRKTPRDWLCGGFCQITLTSCLQVGCSFCRPINSVKTLNG